MSDVYTNGSRGMKRLVVQTHLAERAREYIRKHYNGARTTTVRHDDTHVAIFWCAR